MNKRVKKIFAMGIVMGSIIGGLQITHADTSLIDTSADFQRVSEVQLNEEYERIMNDTNLIKEKVIEEKIIENNFKLVIETVNYKPISNNGKISDGTNFGSYSSIKVYCPQRHYMGTVGVDVQGKKINSSTAKINYIRYSNSGFKSPSKGAYSTNIYAQGNPAKGHVYVSFVCYDGGDYFTGNDTILVQAYPSGNITIR